MSDDEFNFDDVPMLMAPEEDEEPDGKEELKGPAVRVPKDLQRPWQGWVFTDFKMGSTEAEWEGQVVAGKVTYVKWGVEECPETKRKHRQGLVWFSSKQRYTALQAIVKNKCFVQPMKSKDASMEYVSKMKSNVGGWFEAGEWKKAGQRTDLEAVAKACKEANGDLDKVIDQFPGEAMKYLGNMDRLVQRAAKPEDYRTVKAYVLTGPAAVKKTHFPYCKHGTGNVFELTEEAYTKGYWVGYENQKVLFIDEFTSPWIKISDLLKYLEGHPTKVRVLYGTRWARWKYVYIATNREFYDRNFYPAIFSKFPKTREAFRSRIKRWINFTEPYKCNHVVPGQGE